MSHENRNPLVAAAVEAARTQIAEAGTTRDGTGLARCHAVIAIICAMRDAAPEGSSRRAALQDVYSHAVHTAFFATIHDQYARREITMEEYDAALKAGRESYDRIMAQIAAAK